jgi:hypothetical protein
MTRKIYAIALALGMFAAFSTPSHAALSGADRPAVAATQAPAGAVEAKAPTGFTADAPAATATAQAAPATELRKPVINKAKPRIASAAAPRFSAAPRYGHPCH